MPESFWVYCNTPYGVKSFASDAIEDTALEREFLAPAYILDELIDWLPEDIIIEKPNEMYVFAFHLTKNIMNKEYLAQYTTGRSEPILNLRELMDRELNLYDQFDTNPCVVVGKLLIWVIKEGYL